MLSTLGWTVSNFKSVGLDATDVAFPKLKTTNLRKHSFFLSRLFKFLNLTVTFVCLFEFYDGFR